MQSDTGSGCRARMGMWLVWVVVLAIIGSKGAAQAETPVEVLEEKLCYETKLVSVDFGMPQIALVGHPELEAQLNDGWREQVAELVEYVTVSAQECADEFGEEVDHWFPFELAGDFKVGYLNDGFLSIPIRYYYFTGGAHGMSFQETTNVNLQTGRDFALPDLFLPDYDYRQVIREEVIRQMEADPWVYFQESLIDLEITSEQPFYLTTQGVVVYFGLYEIAPYSSGIREFTIPFAHLWDGLQPDIQGISLQ